VVEGSYGIVFVAGYQNNASQTAVLFAPPATSLAAVNNPGNKQWRGQYYEDGETLRTSGSNVIGSMPVEGGAAVLVSKSTGGTTGGNQARLSLSAAPSTALSIGTLVDNSDNQSSDLSTTMVFGSSVPTARRFRHNS